METKTYFEAKVLVPVGHTPSAYRRFIGIMSGRYTGFHAGPDVDGYSLKWGDEPMQPWYFAFEGDPREEAAFLARWVKEVFGEKAVYIAVTRLEVPFIQ